MAADFVVVEEKCPHSSEDEMTEVRPEFHSRRRDYTTSSGTGFELLLQRLDLRSLLLDVDISVGVSRLKPFDDPFGLS